MECPRPPQGRPGVSLLVALALPGVRVAHDGRSSPDAPDLHAVLVDADALLIGEVVVVDALPIVGSAAHQVRNPASLTVLRLAGLGEITLVELGGIAGGVRSDRCHKGCTDRDCRHREGGHNLLLQGLHVKTLSTRNAEEFPRAIKSIS